MRLGVTSNHICCASETVAHFIRSRFPLDPRRVTVLPNAVPVPRNNEILAEPLPGEKGYRMVCVANLRREKDHITLLRAFAEFAKSHPAWVLLLVGNEPDKNLAKNLRRTADELSVAGRVHFLGTRNDVGAI
ncbi:MAG: glycosyltransferase, partial [Kiritimatiellia bacterium]